MRLKQSARGLLVVAFAASGVGCASHDSDGGEGSCAQAYDYRGQTYSALKTENRVPGTRSIGDVSYTACMTSSDDDASKKDAEAKFPAYAVKGIDPSIAFVVPADPRYIYYSGPSDASTFPPGVQKLLNSRQSDGGQP